MFTLYTNLLLALGGVLAAAAQRLCESSSFSPVAIDDVRFLSITAEPQHNYSTSDGGPTLPAVTSLSFCDVTIHITHMNGNDNVSVRIWLPPTFDEWNGRFQATGGGGFLVGGYEWDIAAALKDGFAAATTDGGHQGDFVDLSWVLKDDKLINWPLLQNHATRSLAELVIIGKHITESFYEKPAHHSYFRGCSQGGRQGYMLAQQYPHLLDGILANAPAISMTHLALGSHWPQLVMQQSNTLLSGCEFDYFSKKIFEECDILDGANDGVIVDPEACLFQPSRLVGDKTKCDDKEVEITQEMADVVRKIQEGPRSPFGAPLWHGLAYGTDTNWLANVIVNPDGSRSANPISDPMIKYLVLKDPAFNVSTITYSDYVALWAQASYEYSWLQDADDVNLSSLQKEGTKLLSWHGISDAIIPYQNTVTYRKRVEQVMGSSAGKVDDFYRFFLAPGVDHCGFGRGASPKNAMGQLVAWVEDNDPPETLEAETTNEHGEVITRELCLWPKKMKYMGVGDANRASSWTCDGGDDVLDSGESKGEGESFQNHILNGLKQKFLGLGLPGLRIG
ncbi:Tannase/feruloyl esterase [Lophiotrema nucula]|uniref:Carboxylic ester hydrolase n=1 Tax=Lophiotrema nucula TaxID=690887 RepID=A0A6A5ZFN2_9PLEO|nr:Tannase/feruloyl esterase [Lophiotrema nucula]